jgi:kumamolisin
VDAQEIGPTDPDERVEVSVVVRPRRALDELSAQLASGSAAPMSREEFAAAYGAQPADVAKVTAFARQHGLQVIESSLARRTVRLAGRAADVAAAFGVHLSQLRTADGTTFRAASGPPVVPPELHEIVEGVFGLDTRPVAHRRVG